MNCPSCQSPVPDRGRYCPRCGTDAWVAGAAGTSRVESFALQPGEPVTSFSLVSSLMPLSNGTAPQTYRWALAGGLAIPAVAAALGFLAFAFVAAAVVVPVVYVVYLYDVNQWEDQPVPVVLGTVGLAAVLGAAFTWFWKFVLLDDGLVSIDFSGGTGGLRGRDVLVLCLLVPVVGEILKQVGPIVLAMRPAFDDMIDGLTFGVAAGAAFAAAETIVVNKGLFSAGGTVDNPDAAFWVSLVLTAGIVKPVVYGSATGIAMARFSGLGAGYDGFKPSYFRGLVEAVLANMVFQGGLYLTGQVSGTTGTVLGLAWGLLVAGALIVRLRHLLHTAVLESALEATTRGEELRDTTHGVAYCPACELPLVPGSNFCTACGTAVRAANKITRRRNAADDGPVLDPAAVSTAGPTEGE